MLTEDENKINNKLPEDVYEFLEMLLPYVMYYSLRFNQTDPQLPQTMGQIINKILDSDFIS